MSFSRGLTICCILASVGPSILGATPAGATINPGSTTFGGYTGQLAASIPTNAKATLKVPSVTCPATGSADLVFEFEVSGSGFGEEFQIEASCTNGAATYLTDLQFASSSNGSFENVLKGMVVPAGDQLDLTTTDSTTSSLETIKDSTSGKVVSFRGPAVPSTAATLTVGVYPVFLTTGSQTIPTFTVANFQTLTINSLPLSSVAVMAHDLVDSANTVLIHTGPLAKNGESFPLTFKNNT